MKVPAKTTTPKIVSTYVNLTGVAVTGTAAIAKAYRELADKDLSHLSDAQVEAIVKSVPGDGTQEDIVSARVTKLEAAQPQTHGKDELPVTPLPKDMSAMSAQQKTAVELGQSMPETMVAHIQLAAKAKEEWDGAPLMIADDIEKQWGLLRKGKSKEEPLYMAWPEFGTGTKKWHEDNPKSNIETDHFKVARDDGKGSKDQSWYALAFDKTEPGHALVTAIMQLEALPETILPGTPQDFIDIKDKKDELASVLKTRKKRRENSYKRFGKAAQFCQQRYRILHEMGDKVAVSYSSTKMETVYASPTPLVLSNLAVEPNPLTGQVIPVSGGGISLGSFVKYKVDEAVRNGGTLAALTATTKRKPQTGETPATGATGESKEGKNIPTCPNPKEADAMIAGLTTMLGDTAANGAFLKAIGAPNMNHLIEGLFDLKAKVVHVCALPAIEERFQAIIDEQTGAKPKMVNGKRAA